MEKEKLIPWWVKWIIFPCIVIAWIATPIVYSFFYKSPENPGIFGEMYGATNALFSGLMLLGILVTLFLQRQDLKITKQELREQREQQIFFELMNLHEKIVDAVTYAVPVQEDKEPLNGFGIAIIDNQYISRGRDSFYWFSHGLQEVMTSGESPFTYDPTGELIVNEERLGQVLTEVRRFYSDGAGKSLDRYFRSVKRILEFLDGCSELHAKSLSDTFLAQLTVEETLQISYYSTNVSDEDFKRLIQKYKVTDYDDLRISILGGIFMKIFEHTKNQAKAT
ncbi:MAG: putative phage abortive infection protein [Thermoleophilia bacterium]